jgi:hypothetical protein
MLKRGYILYLHKPDEEDEKLYASFNKKKAILDSEQVKEAFGGEINYEII